MLTLLLSVSGKAAATQRFDTDRSLIGNYTLRIEAPHSPVLPYSQVLCSYTIEGVGKPPVWRKLLPDLPDITYRLEIESADRPNRIVRRFHYYILADHNFTLPAVTLHAYDPKQQRRYLLKVPPQKITLAAVTASDIVDREAYPKTPSLFRRYADALFYLILFLVGFGVTRMLLRRRSGNPKRGGRDGA